MEPFTRAQAWIDLIGNANHKDGSFLIRGNIIKLKRGQLGWSEITMAERWTWSRNKVRRFLKWLETEQQIEQQKLFKLTTIITICNYDKYQNDTADDTTERQQKDNRRYTNKNDKNDKNVKKREYTHPNKANIDDIFLQEVADKNQVPVSFVRSKYEDMVLWHEQNPTKNKKVDWKATLRAWTKKDSLQIKQDYAKRNSEANTKRSVDLSGV